LESTETASAAAIPYAACLHTISRCTNSRSVSAARKSSFESATNVEVNTVLKITNLLLILGFVFLLQFGLLELTL
jgi:hypothetical protein